ncbi:hypothetical protein ScPMuIL_002700 [Solemya velum]
MAQCNLKTDFTGKRALVTGAGRGLGKAITRALVERGAMVFALDKMQENLVILKEELPSVQIICVDLQNWDETRKAVSEAGPIDYLVNNAGYLAYKPILETSRQEIDDMLGVNLRAMINVSQVIGSGMVERGQVGSIVNISSVASHRYDKNAGIYCTTKAAVDMLTRSLAKELGPYNIRVNSVNPSLMMTEMVTLVVQDRFEQYIQNNAVPRAVEIDDVVKMIMFQLSDNANSMTGANVLVDAGNFA